MRLQLAIAIPAVFLAGCLHLHPDPSYSGPAPLTAEIVGPFTYEPSEPAWSNHVTDRNDRWTLRRITLASSVNVVEGHEITIDLYDLLGETPRPLILVLPTLGGDNDVAALFAEYFARRGYAAAIVHRQEGYLDIDELEQLNPIFRQVVLDHRQAVDLLAQRPGIDPQRIGLFGISAGAIKGALVAALDDRIGPAVLGLAGGDVPYLFAYSQEGGLVQKRAGILAEHDIDQAELHRVLAEEFVHDPLEYARHLDARRTLLILARFDAAIPFAKGMELREAIGGPRTIILPTGHYGAIAYVPYIQSVAWNFFRRDFEGRGPAHTPVPPGRWMEP